MSLVRLIYTQNPFYLLSACCVFFGLRSLFGNGSVPSDEWKLLTFLGGYEVLLVATGIVLVRWGRLWNDARSIFLIALLLALALSSSFDERLVDGFGSGIALLVTGLGLTAGASEAVLRLTKLPLARGYRVAYHMIVAMFFLYPILPAALGTRSGAADIAVVAFGPLVALLHLCLLIPLLRGAHSIRQEAPWRFPYYPWTLYALLLLCGLARGYYLCLSFGSGTGEDTLFAPYLMAPALLVVAVLLYAGGWRHRREWTQRVGITIPAAAIALCLVPLTSPVQLEFLDRLTRYASPVQLVLVASGLFYAVAARSGHRTAKIALAVTIVAFAVVDRTTVSIDTVTFPHAGPLALISIISFLRWRRGMFYRMVAGFSLLAAFSVASASGEGALGGFDLYIAAQVAFGWVGIVFVISRDPGVERLRRVAMIGVPLDAALSFAVLWHSPGLGPSTLAIVSLIALPAMQITWILRHRGRPDIVTAIATGSVYVARAALELRSLSGDALTIVVGMVLFAFAFGISAVKIVTRRRLAAKRPEDSGDLLEWQPD